MVHNRFIEAPLSPEAAARMAKTLGKSGANELAKEYTGLAVSGGFMSPQEATSIVREQYHHAADKDSAEATIQKDLATQGGQRSEERAEFARRLDRRAHELRTRAAKLR